MATCSRTLLKLNKLKTHLYSHNVTIVRKYTENHYKVTCLNSLREKGVEAPKNYVKKNSVNDKKLADNITRAKQKIYELAMCNEWDYFFTGTISPEKFDRTNISLFQKTLTKFFSNYSRKNGDKITFLLIPELHSDKKTWHVHGLLKGINVDNLVQFKLGDTMGKTLAVKVAAGDTVYNWIDYQENFGFCDLEPIKSHDAVSAYITKYITKDMADSNMALGAHLYYHSRNLKCAQVIKKGLMDWSSIKPNFENEHCKIYNCSAYQINNVLNNFID